MNHLSNVPTSTLLSTPGQAGLATILVQGDSRPGGAPVEAPETAPKGLFGGGFGMLPMVLIFAIFWFVMIGPERKNRKAREDMLANLKKGDEVMTSSGLYAKVITVQEDVVVLQIAEGVRAKFSRAAVQSVVPKGEHAKSSEAPKLAAESAS